MPAHTELNSKVDFDNAIGTQGKYVLVHAYSGQVLDKAEEFAQKYASNCDFYAVDTAKEPKTKDYFGITQTPAAMLYKDGKQVVKVEGKTAEGMGKIAQLLS
ncbi:hypothetical protein BDY17DRAFT_324066 [Neohortaea acidophila]|uniref:Thioredoxin domain-containing protein n=1 Tax=Neohortaea acidophila TaxID=245834 RepID=A0A6A6PUF4_9PEZI|nr:uncharacterized protein BDY17DRAFT_324066 [Neohortaea acidophila]KAF2483321.1 hypothetical protein BDY17DRAFT_324066 [Neohortaea acidophila]